MRLGGLERNKFGPLKGRLYIYVTTENRRMVVRKNMKGRKTQIKVDGQAKIMITHKQRRIIETETCEGIYFWVR